MPTPTPLLLPVLLAVSCRALGDPLAAGGRPQAGTTHSPEPLSPSPAAPHRSVEPPGAGHDDCPPLGLESLGVDDTQLSASSMERVGLGPHRGRLNIQAGIFEHDYYDGAWCADPQDPDPWLQVDGRRLIRFTGVITQGRNSIWSWHWVTSYQLLFSNDTHTWIPYGDGDTVSPTSNPLCTTAGTRPFAHPPSADHTPIHTNPIPQLSHRMWNIPAQYRPFSPQCGANPYKPTQQSKPSSSQRKEHPGELSNHKGIGFPRKTAAEDRRILIIMKKNPLTYGRQIRNTLQEAEKPSGTSSPNKQDLKMGCRRGLAEHHQRRISAPGDVYESQTSGSHSPPIPHLPSHPPPPLPYPTTLSSRLPAPMSAGHSAQECPSPRGVTLYPLWTPCPQVMRRIRKECPNITRTYSIGRSFQGRKMYVMEISDNPGVHELGEPEFRYVAGMHGNEVLGRDLLILLMEYLCKEYRRKNPRVRRIVDSTRIHLLPSMNPDGYEMAHRMGSELVGWVYGRWTMEGYDLNHNFANLNSVMWADEEEQEDPSRVRNHFIPIPATYRWANASVATETRAVINWMKKIPFVLSANLHGGDMVVCYPFDQGREPDIDYQPSPTPDEDVFRWLSFAYASSHRVMAQYNHRLCHGDNFMQRGNIINGANWHSMTGSMNDFSYLHTNCFEVTVELSCDKFPHYSWLPLEWDNNRESLLLYMEQVHLGIKGVVKDHLGHGIHGAVIAVEGINHHVRTAADGDYWRLLNPGHYEVTASAAGFVPSTQTCAVGYHSPPTICNFQLTRRLVSGRRNSRTRGKGTRVPSRRKDPTHHRDPFRRRRLHGH
ncbi:probable carboxypeptidase X1 [Narcine bancroftii]|uniref:probable carboxypeptidase X1 n=1 Tax=Narcine bancroftii TaxID=1343680 RepID=UPI003832099B